MEMRICILSFVLIFCSFCPVEEDLLPKGPARKKLDNAIRAAFGTEDFSLVYAADSGSAAQSAPPSMDGTRMQVLVGGKEAGYALFSSAMGRYDKFDFVVLYSMERTILHVEVLEYRSDHGFEITSKKWLAQFKGKTGCGLVYGKDIDAVSGATLSGTSLVNAIASFCEKEKIK